MPQGEYPVCCSMLVIHVVEERDVARLGSQLARLSTSCEDPPDTGLTNLLRQWPEPCLICRFLPSVAKSHSDPMIGQLNGYRRH